MESRGFIDNAGSALATVTDILSRADAIYGASGSLSEEDRRPGG